MAHKTSAPGSVSGAYVDRNVGTSTPGTGVVAVDMNTFQDEICNAVQGAGYTLSSSNDQLLAAIRSLSHTVGEYLFSSIKRAVSAAFPAVRIDTSDVTIASANYPDLVTALYNEAAMAQNTTSFSCTISGSNITFPNTTAANKLLAALAEDSKVHGGGGESSSFSNWRTLTVGTTNYAITAINTSTRVVTVSGTPASGTQTVVCYPYRIAGSSTSVRLYKTTARALMSHNDDSIIAGLRRRDYGQGHWHDIGNYTQPRSGGAAAGGSFITYALGNGSANPELIASNRYISDGTNGTPRTSDHTEARGMGAYLYIWAGRYIA